MPAFAGGTGRPQPGRCSPFRGSDGVAPDAILEEAPPASGCDNDAMTNIRNVMLLSSALASAVQTWRYRSVSCNWCFSRGSEAPVHDVQTDAAECWVVERLGNGADDLKPERLPESDGDDVGFHYRVELHRGISVLPRP